MNQEQPTRVAHVIVPDDHTKTVFNAVSELLNSVTDNLETVVTPPEQPDIEWDENSPCPACGHTELRVMAPGEEVWTFNDELETLEYNGRSSDTAVLSGQWLRVFCPECDELLKVDEADALIDYQTL